MIEAIAVIVIVGVTVPPVMFTLDRAAQRQNTAINAVRTSALLQSMLERTLADAANPNWGPDFIRSGSYIKRFGVVDLPDGSTLSDMGYSWNISTLDGIDPSGVVGTPDPVTNPFIMVTASVTPPLGMNTQYASVLIVQR